MNEHRQEFSLAPGFTNGCISQSRSAQKKMRAWSR
jgi:hypothetical protein